MDCERLDELAIDLVDPEGAAGLDARTRREADEHLAGCARCRSLVDRLGRGMKAAAELPLEDASSLLEARILAAASGARPPPRLGQRVARAVSTAGRWAMRPQVAMAAVLVVMVGTSVVLLRGGGLPSRRTKVTEEGTPVATLDLPPQDPGGTPAIIGADKKPEAPKEEKEAQEKSANEQKVAKGGDTPAQPKADLDGVLAEKPAPAKGKSKDVAEADDETVAKAVGGVAKPTTPPAAAAPAPPPPADFGGGEGKAETAKKTASAGPMATATTAPAATVGPSTYDDAMTAYKEARYPAAAKGFEASANGGVKPASSWLYAARSLRAAGSCVQALPRFQKVVTGYAGTPEAPYAALEGGQCAKATGDVATARALFEKAKASTSTQKQAEAELAALNAPASKAKASDKSISDSY